MGEDLFTCVEPAVLWEEETLRKWQLDFATYKPNLQWSQGILVREKARVAVWARDEQAWILLERASAQVRLRQQRCVS